MPGFCDSASAYHRDVHLSFASELPNCWEFAFRCFPNPFHELLTGMHWVGLNLHNDQ